MNKVRRKTIADLRERLDALLADLQMVKDEVETVQGEEQDYLESIPENLQASEKYSNAENAVGLLDSAFMGLDDAASSIESAMNDLEEATN